MSLTVNEILEGWESGYDHRDWHAVDEITADGRVLRLMVGLADEASAFLTHKIASPAYLHAENGLPIEEEPGWNARAPFYRQTSIEKHAAWEYFAALSAQTAHVGRFLTMREAAEARRCTKQSIHELIRRGRLRAEMIGGEWRIPGESLDLFVQQKAPGGRRKDA